MLNVLAVNIFFAPYFAPCNYTFYLKENNFQGLVVTFPELACMITNQVNGAKLRLAR